MTPRENLLRAARFDRPEWIPISIGVNPSCWERHPREELAGIMADHPVLFPEFRPPAEGAEPQYAPWRRSGRPHTDSWGCVWETLESGVTGTVTRPSLPNWSALDGFVAPDSAAHDGWQPVDWTAVAAGVRNARARVQLTRGGLRHGHTFLTMSYMRGYENLILDMADGEPRLYGLIDMVERFNAGLVQRYVELGVEWMGYPEDLGMQRGPMLSPEHFRRYIKPSYTRLIAPAREAGCVIHMHSDGDVRDLAEDLLEGGVEVLNLQDLVNDVDWIAANLKGRVCIDLDIDRQSVTRFGTPRQIDEHIRHAVTTLGAVEGGLMMVQGLAPDVPLENARALMDAMERYAGHFS